MHQRPNAPPGQRKPHYAADQGEEHTLGEELVKEPAPPGAEGGPHRNFPIASSSANQKQVGDIGTDDEEHQYDAPHEGDEK